MRLETKAISVFIVVMTLIAVLLSYLDFIGLGLINILGDHLLLTYQDVTYNFAFLVPIIIGIILVLLGTYSRTKYVDYALLAIGGAILMTGAINIFTVLIEPHLALLTPFLLGLSLKKEKTLIRFYGLTGSYI